MTDRIKRDARARAAVTGESYTRARRAVAATAVTDRTLLTPYPDENGVTDEELGWRVLPADATPEQRAHAEAVWRPVSPSRPCRCSGPCHHGTRCEDEALDDDGQAVPCGGQLLHVDRYPGSMFSVIVWDDVYRCDTCGAAVDAAVNLPEIPWGETNTVDTASGPQRVTTVYSGVRHPNLDEDAWDDDGVCPDCGNNIDDQCTCYKDQGCPECGAGGPGDPYGECVCYPE